MAAPFIPGKAQTLWRDLGMEGEVSSVRWDAAESPSVAGRTVRRPTILFPKPANV
jgi:methionyl-tRNA synthetase